jgi:hypothetical protein
MRRSLWFACATLALPLAITAQPSAQLPAGPEFLVNSYSFGSQMRSSVAMNAAGDFVVVWERPEFSSMSARLFDSAGTPIGSEFTVNGYVPASQPIVVAAPSGEFVVVWTGLGMVGGVPFSQIKARKYDAAGNSTPGEVVVDLIPHTQTGGSVAIDAAGNFVIAWTSRDEDGSDAGVFGKRFSASGSSSPKFQINSFTTGNQTAGGVAMDADGTFVVVWSGLGQGAYGVFARRFSATGAAMGAEFPVTTTPATSPRVASAANGQFVVVWSRSDVNLVTSIGGRLFDSSGDPIANEFLVDLKTATSMGYASVSSDPAGNFVVSWTSRDEDGSGSAVLARSYEPSGSPLGPKFRVNTFTTGDQWRSAVAQGHHGDLVVTWDNLGQQSPDDVGVFGQRYSDRIFRDDFEAGRRARVVVNEFNANMGSDCDMIELRAVAGGPMDGILLRAREAVLAVFNGLVVERNDLIVVHLDSADANCNPGGASDETTSVAQFPASAHSRNYDTAWDWYSPERGLANTDNVFTVTSEGRIVDAVLAADDPTGAAAPGSESQAALVAAAGHWQMVGGGVPPGGFVDDDFCAHAVLDLDATGADPVGTSIQRTTNLDSNDKNGWTAGAGAPSTWGLLNVGQTPF